MGVRVLSDRISSVSLNMVRLLLFRFYISYPLNPHVYTNSRCINFIYLNVLVLLNNTLMVTCVVINNGSQGGEST